MRLSAADPNSYAQPENVLLTHADLDWTVDFNENLIRGSVLYKFQVIADPINEIILDVNDLKIDMITAEKVPLEFKISDVIEYGAKLTIILPTCTSDSIDIQITYETSSSASGLQWLKPEQTTGKKFPFMYSQLEPIHARSVLPCQDTPSVKFTYKATLKYPPHLVGLMSATVLSAADGVSTFEQTVPIPSYLIAVAVGKLVTRVLSPLSSVWAEEELVDDAAYEFAETELMLRKAEDICGSYVWKKYDILVLPPSFPYGGMENPCLTFVTPALIAKNRSLAYVIVHEIAHSWTGNLVTNKNFEHLWLNEGFTVFLEGKILGALKGPEFRDFHAIHRLSELQHNIKTQLSNSPELTKLVPNLSQINPEDSFSLVPYVKGMTFLRYIEQCVGGPTVFDPFLRFYLNKYMYQSVDTNDFKTTILKYFTDLPPNLNELNAIDWNLWLFGEGMPPIVPHYDQTLANLAMEHAKLWAENPLVAIKASPIIKDCVDIEIIDEILDKLLEYEEITELNESKIEFLSQVYKVETDGNIEIRLRYFLLVIRARIFPKLDEILNFANSNFRMKYVRDIYRALGKWPEARDAAIANFHAVQHQMMKVCATQCAKELQI